MVSRTSRQTTTWLLRRSGAIYAPLVPVVMVDESDMGLPHMVGGPLGSDDDSDVDDLPELVDE